MVPRNSRRAIGEVTPVSRTVIRANIGIWKRANEIVGWAKLALASEGPPLLDLVGQRSQARLAHPTRY